MTKYFVVAAIAAAFTTSTASAGGLSGPVYEPVAVVPYVVAPITSWTGGYVGGNLTYGNAKIKATGNLGSAVDTAGLNRTLSEPDGFSGGLRAGYDWQSGAGVFGVGGEYNLGKYSAGLTGDYNATVDADVKIKDAGTIFARAGYAFNNNLMGYGLLGYTWANGKASSGGVTESRSLDGATYGVGAEYKFNTNWSSYAEYTYTDFGKIENTNGDLKANLGQVKIGVNYRF